MRIIVTGGAGFIGSAVIRHIIENTDDLVVNVDKLTYAGNTDNLDEAACSKRYAFEKIDIGSSAEMERVFSKWEPHAIMHLAAESHVDRSISAPVAFMETNILGTYTLLEVARRYWQMRPVNEQERFRFHHVSTDEVYGDLGYSRSPFREDSPYKPNSPYSASKASSDHLVRAWNRTYGLPTLITNCTNNYGPFQYPEKLIPLTIFNALEGRALRVYGEGQQIRDWLYVEDHAEVLYKAVTEGEVGETYNIGACNERKNIEVVETVCDLLEEMAPDKPIPNKRYRDLVEYVPDRPGHDRRYAIDGTKAQRELGWVPHESFESGIRKTVEWYLTHREWCRSMMDRAHKYDSAEARE